MVSETKFCNAMLQSNYHELDKRLYWTVSFNTSDFIFYNISNFMFCLGPKS